MRGGQVFMESLLLHGADRIFGNPGTTENPLLDRLIDYPQIKYYTALHESVAVGAANFYAQASGKTAIANLHVAPGLGNGIGMMYNALKANTPLIVTAGQQDTRMRMEEPLLSHNLVAMAEPVTKWSVEPQSADEIGPIMRRAFRIANEHPCGPVFISLPVDVMEQETDVLATTAGNLFNTGAADPTGISQLVNLLNDSQSPAIIVGDDVARAGAVDQLVVLSERLGAAVFQEGLRAQTSFPNQHGNFSGRIPFEANNSRVLLAPFDTILMIGGSFFENIWFEKGSPIPEQSKLIQLEESHAQLTQKLPLDLGLVGGIRASMEALLIALGDDSGDVRARTRNKELQQQHQSRKEASRVQLESVWDVHPMTPKRAIYEISKALPADTVVVDESITAGPEISHYFDFKNPGDFYAGRGGGIGQGLAGAIGVQVAHPDRPVIALSGDGSAMYSIQAFWSAAHHQLPIVFVILCNREYRVLKHNMDIYRDRFSIGSNKPYPHMDLTNPLMEFATMAQGMGMSGETITQVDDIAPAIAGAFEKNVPYVVEIVVSGKQ